MDNRNNPENLVTFFLQPYSGGFTEYSEARKVQVVQRKEVESYKIISYILSYPFGTFKFQVTQFRALEINAAGWLLPL